LRSRTSLLSLFFCFSFATSPQLPDDRHSTSSEASLPSFLLEVSGFANVVSNVFIMGAMQLSLHGTMRSKAFSLTWGMMTQELTPVAFASAGVLAEFIPIALLMGAGFAVTIAVDLPFMILLTLA
jgi:hypothetical protein